MPDSCPKIMQGRRIYPDKGDKFSPGDYGLEQGEWHCRTPDPNIGLGSLVAHTVTEHEDGTITVTPSIVVSYPEREDGNGGQSWHGWLRAGIWTEA